ncbi:MAG TPA: YqgE/AlgH family protein [Candidatus Polarisedimenticolaceae bacterium]|nr:YqgE/AlgH family protein [Candidatus Polarisedimenticolaceae bacterium]
MRWIRQIVRAAAVAATLAASGSPVFAGIEATYLANEGFFLTGGGKKVLIDASFDAGIAPYAVLADTTRHAIATGAPPFDDVDLLLATHVHADHFAPEVVLSHLRANPRARFVSTPDAIAALEPLLGGDASLAERITAVYPDEGRPETLERSGVPLRVINLHHGRGGERPVQNLGFVVTLGDTRLLHVGDTVASADELGAAAIGPVDVAFLPYWLLIGAAEARVVGADRIVAMHLPPAGAPAGHFDPYASFEDAAERIARLHPGAVVPARQGERRVLERPKPRSHAPRRAAPPTAWVTARTAAGPGRFLVAHREMLDPNFAETVVLLVDHDANGALGLVINRPSELTLSALSSEIEGLRGRDDPVYVGGPVPGGPIFVLIRDDAVAGDAKRVIDGVYLSRDQAILEHLTGRPADEFRVYAGYAGWAPGQLDHELERGDWHVVPAAADWVFDPRPAEVWRRLVPPEPSRQAMSWAGAAGAD